MKNYLIIAIAIIVAGAYFFGARIGRMKCQSSARRAETKEIENIIVIKRNTDEKVFNTGVDDIRRILHTKYTIAE
ncbi:MAG: hypothetical protein J6S80_03245 [Alphaproteobacteria bacterium]|jgi:hypothetical protein|nr:hypothetical protein [Alphaproteobacteria bacterium]